MNADAGREAQVDIDTASNQSLGNAAYMLAAKVRGTASHFVPGSDTDDDACPASWLAAVTAKAERRRADHVVRRMVQAAHAIVLGLLIAVGVATGWGGDRLGQAATYGLACLAIVLISPVAWTHYFVLWLPGILFVPVWLARRGHAIASRASVVSPAVLIWGHYLAKPWTGAVGVLGLGTMIWFVAVASLIALTASATKA
jgi:hypothetical protein